MAKKKRLADRVRGSKKEQERKINPFEVKFNKQKHKVLGRKISKHDCGMPGLSRSKAVQRRKETLLVEYKQKDKANKFVDKRFGEEDTELSVEDKMLKRFALERQKYHEKAGAFNLNEEEELTHYGQSLSQIEKFEDPEPESDDDEDRGKIDAQQVADEHFGGFLTKKSSNETETAKSWKERMEETIARSKKEKYEKQKEREEFIQMTQKVDEEWKELRALMGGGKKSTDDTPPSKTVDDYDVTVRELQFEIKAKASDRLKTDEELAVEEKERLEKLEADRIRRMKGILEEDTTDQKRTHASADDLDDGFILDGDKSAFHVSYKDGKLLTEDQDEVDEEEEGDEDAGSDENDDGAVTDDGDGEDDDSDEGDEEDNHSDLESNEDQGSEDDGKTEKKPKRSAEEIKKELKERKTIMDAARKELPYTFPAPETYQDLLNLLENHCEADQLTIIGRLRKCHHPSLAEGNKEKLEHLFSLLLQYFGDLALQDKTSSLMNKLTLHLYELCQMSPIPAGQAVIDIIMERQEAFTQYCQRKGGRGLYPGLDMLMLFKLISVLFPTSDLRHPVVTPTMLFMGQILTQCPVQNMRDVTAGLFICNLFLEYVSLSKRFIPEVINYLRGLLFLGILKKNDTIENVIPPFKPVGNNIDLLKIQMVEKSRSLPVDTLDVRNVFHCTDLRTLNTDRFRVCAMCTTLRLLIDFAKLYEQLPAYKTVFAPIKEMYNKLPTSVYPEEVLTVGGVLLGQLDYQNSKEIAHLVMERKKPKPLKMYEPQIEEGGFDGRKKRGGNRDLNEKQRLIHKHKKELKGAVREIRKDNQFLARQKLHDQIERDETRKRKVKEIHHMLANQEGDYKAMKRKKEKF